MKKVFIFLCLSFITVSSLIINLQANTLPFDDRVVEAVGATYQVTERKVDENLNYNLHYISDLAQSSSQALIGGTGSIDPQAVNILEIPSSSVVRVVNWTYSSSSKWTKATVRKLAEDFEQKNPGWIVLAGINGDFFDINGKRALPFQTTGVSVNNGEVVRPVKSQNSIGFTNDGSTNSVIGAENFEVTAEHYLTIYGSNGEVLKKVEINKFNSEPVQNDVSIYFGFRELVDGEVVDRFPIPPVSNFTCLNSERCYGISADQVYAKGAISNLNYDKQLFMGQFAIVTHNQEIIDLLNTGVTVRVQQDVIGDYANCDNITGGGATLVKNGEAPRALDGMSDYRHPRTVVGKKADGTIVFGVVDGRQQDQNMYGMTYEELSAMMMYYGCVDAYNLDGGGSTTMIIRNAFGSWDTVNSPSDGSERSDSNALFVVVPEMILKLNEVTDTTADFSYSIGDKDIKVSNVELIVKGNNKIITKALDSTKITLTDLEPNTEYTYTYSYDIEYKGNKVHNVSNELTFATGQIRPTISNYYYEKMDDFIVCYFTIKDDFGLAYSITIRCGNKVEFLNPSKTTVLFDVTTLDDNGIIISLEYNVGATPSSTIREIYEVKEKQNEVKPSEPQTPTPIEKKKKCGKKSAELIISLISISSLFYLIRRKK